MQTESMNCPNCGAPLRVQPGQTLSLCLYCNASIRIYYATSSGTQVSQDTAVSPDTVGSVKQLLFSGRRPEAVALYQKETGADPQAAASAVESFGREITFDVMFSQRLSPVGILLVLTAVVVSLGAVVAAATGRVQWTVALITVAAFGVILSPFIRAIPITLKYLGARTAAAKVLRFAKIGETKNFHAFRVLLEVQPEHEQSFRAEINLPVRAANLTKLQVGALLQVKYFAGDTSSVKFDRILNR